MSRGFAAYLAVVLAGVVGYQLGCDRRLVDRRPRRPAAPRAARPLVAPDTGANRACRPLVRSLGRLGRVRRPDHAGRPVVHLDPGRRLRDALPALQRADPRSATRSGASSSQASAGRSARATSSSTTIFATSRSPSCSRSVAGAAYLLLRRAPQGYDECSADGDSARRRQGAVRAADPGARRTRSRGTLESGRFIFGPEVEAFERESAELLGVEQTVSCANGTDAIVLVLDAMEIGPGDEVICPAFTFYATAEAIARARRDAGVRRDRPGRR